ncbi:hypothetical protein CWC22_017980 [Pseudoalteromonas rubra]|uniref:Uncharacterized protein n=1 Tax=Pseudoalteromonas rubra TaxID=43658 RepID=A0A5S3V141_9GAMM|nr:hypothetical protein [Pseudoalteromonas rubra]QPB84770.1 hypothetical protein CWC22_017980 [Pseudoalteromonas rubra]
MKISLNKKSIKQLSNNQQLGLAQTPHVAGGASGHPACESLGCDTAVFLGCPTGGDCYSGRFEICMPD